jgi:hypothetical protein
LIDAIIWRRFDNDMSWVEFELGPGKFLEVRNELLENLNSDHAIFDGRILQIERHWFLKLEDRYQARSVLFVRMTVPGMLVEAAFRILRLTDSILVSIASWLYREGLLVGYEPGCYFLWRDVWNSIIAFFKEDVDA